MAPSSASVIARARGIGAGIDMGLLRAKMGPVDNRVSLITVYGLFCIALEAAGRNYVSTVIRLCGKSAKTGLPGGTVYSC